MAMSFFYSVDLQWRRYEVVWTSEQSKLSVEVCTGIRINGLQLVPRYSYGNGGNGNVAEMGTRREWELLLTNRLYDAYTLPILSVFSDTA